MDRDTLIAKLVDHYKNPRHKGPLEGAEISIPGGNPGCGDLITVHLKSAADEDRIAEVTFEGSGCTISQAAASILLRKVNREHPAFQNILDFSYEEMLDLLGRDVVGFRERCATLALGTLKGAIKALQTDRRLRAAGYSDEDIRRLRSEVASQASGDGLVIGADTETTTRDAAEEPPVGPGT
jgi:nitrogen fixation NifU-like protein